MTAQMRLSSDNRTMDMVIRPFFQSVTASRPNASLSVIPGGSN